MNVIEKNFDGSEFLTPKKEPAIPKVRKALKKKTQKVYNSIETMWYICGTASRGNII